MKIMSGPARLALAVAMTTCASGAVRAAEPHLDYSLRAGGGYSDNLGRSDTDTVSSAFYSAGGTLDYLFKSARTDAAALADFDWIDYDDQSFDSQVLGSLNGHFRYQLVPERFTWVFEDNFGQSARDPFSPSTSNNTENMNFFTTGPDLALHFGHRMGLEMDARYSNVWYQRSVNDNDRYSAGASLVRYLSEASRVFLRTDYNNVQFSGDSLSPDYDRWNAYAGYASENARTKLTVDAGYSSLHRAGQTESGPLFRLGWSRTLSESLTADLRGGYEYNDSAGALGFNQAGGGAVGAGTGGVVSTGDVFEDSYGAANLHFDKLRTRIGAGVEYHHENYLAIDALDRDRTHLYADFTRRVGRPFTVTFSAAYDMFNYTPGSTLDYDELALGAGGGWQVGPTVVLSLDYWYYQRPGSSFGTYDENRIWLRAAWSPSRR